MVTTLEEGRAAVAVRNFELVVIDRGLPDGDGLALLRDLKQQKPSPATIVLTALDDPVDIARALDDGADDYVAKPFEPIELVARAKAVLRRLFLDRGAVVRIGNLSYDVLNREVCVDHQPIVVPRRELAILEAWCGGSAALSCARPLKLRPMILTTRFNQTRSRHMFRGCAGASVRPIAGSSSNRSAALDIC